ncbi:MAG TPA: M20/M25/M40 family metallo-hydrolase [Thermoanaerobaculia bacterium]
MIPRTFLLIALLSLATIPAHAAGLADEVEAFLHVVSVAGREEPARDFVRSRLQGLPVEQDATGNVVLTFGSGSPRRLVACSLGEPGYVITRIEPDGYLRLFPSGRVLVGALWDQAHEGNVVVVGGVRGWVPGGVVLRSAHLIQGPGGDFGSRGPFGVDEMWVDVGAESAAEVEALGVRLLDPVALIRRPSRLAGGLIAGPSARTKAACVAQIDAARRFQPGEGTVVFAWTANDLVNGSGFQHLLRTRGPFDQALVLNRGFGWKGGESGPPVPEALPAAAGLLGAGELPARISIRTAPHIPPAPAFAQSFDWGDTRVGYLGLPARYPDTPVEAVSGEDVERLSEAVLTFTATRGRSRTPPPPLPPPPAIAQIGQGHDETASLLATLIAIPAVSGAEGPLREEIRRRLPAWAKPEVDAKGNLTVTFGQGNEHILFVAHMDEVGYRVAEVLPDGRLRLETRGGMLTTVWEAQAALVHGERGPVPAVFEPREDWRTAGKQALTGPLTAYLGVSSAREAEALGVRAGSTVTMPKQMLRMGEHRAVARGFDDRNGCTALLLALRQIDPAKLTRRVTFAWVVEEETGLVGSRELANRLTDLTRVHPIDTFVSADSPRESRQYAYAPLGKGVVLRTMDNASLVPRPLIDRFLSLAGRDGIPVQYGFTGGASDGVAFLPNGVEMLPFSWPGRYSHSPIEVSDLRDVEALTRLIVATVAE